MAVCDVSYPSAPAHSVLRDEFYPALHNDRNAHSARVFTAAGVWGEDVVWCNRDALLHYFNSHADGR